MYADKIFSKIDELSNEVVTVCSELIKRPSDHPEGRTDGCVEYIKDYFAGLGIASEIFERDEGKPNIVIRIKGASRRKIIWLGHNDVVPPGDLEKWRYPPFSGKIADGKVWGRGASDMKGSNSSAMMAARVLTEIEPPFDIDFWFTADEEKGGRAGASWLAQEGMFEGEVAIIGDSSGCTPGLVNVGVGHKGGIGIRLTAEGKTAHGSTPYLGENAIDRLIEVIPYIKRLGDYRLEIPEDMKQILKDTAKFMLTDDRLNEDQKRAVEKLFYYPSGPSLNTIHGGIAGNVVPDYAEASFDIRLTPGINALKVKEQAEKLFNEANVPQVTLHARAAEKVGYYEKSDDPAVVALSKAVETVTNEKPLLTLAPWGTDAISLKRNVTSEKYPEGIPCILFGPMLRDQLHQPNEYVTINNLITAAKVYSLFPFYYQ